MLSIVGLLLLILSSLIAFKISKRKFYKHAVIGFVNALILEILVYGVFLLFILKATCFFLIGNQFVLDNLIKTRLIYATYFAHGKRTFVNQIDNTLGYTIGQKKDAGFYQTNQQGFRSTKEYSLIPKDHSMRIVALGDSFVWGDDEKNSDTWPYILENSVNNLEVLNFGVPGFGLGQSYLRYLKDGLKYKPDIVFINYIEFSDRDKVDPNGFVHNDNLRLAHFYRVRFSLEDGKLISKATTPFDLFVPEFRQMYVYSPLGYSENSSFWSSKIFSLTNTGLFVKHLALKRRFKRQRYKYQYGESDEKVNEKILDNLIKTAILNGSKIIFFYKKDITELPVKVQQVLSNYAQDVTYVNSQRALGEGFLRYGIKDRVELHNVSGHFNPQGNKIYAEVVLDILKNKQWGAGSRSFQFNEIINGFQ